jgi:hypothetical protein
MYVLIFYGKEVKEVKELEELEELEEFLFSQKFLIFNSQLSII